MKIVFVSLGCSKNQVDSERVMGLLKQSGHQIITNPASADAIFINTCGFITSAKQEGIQTIFDMIEYKQKKCKKLIVLGCLAQRYKTELEKELSEVDRFIGVQEYGNLAAILEEVLEEPILGQYGKGNRYISKNPASAYLKIAEGCSNQCAYCAIPLIRGKQVSESIEDLVSEAKHLALSGVKELVLIAQDTTRYGIDLYQAYKLPDLLIELNQIAGLKWIRILYMYPDKVTDSLLEVMRNCDKVLPYFDIPFQHIDDGLLKLMKRHTSAKQLWDTVKRIRVAFPNAILRSTLIVGFPSESDAQFNSLISAVKMIEFDRLGAFMYSPEEDTPAFKMKDDVPSIVKEERFLSIMEVQSDISTQKALSLIDQVFEVLVESYDEQTLNYHGRSWMSAPDQVDGEVIFTSKQKLNIGTFVQVKITQSTDYDLIGEMVNNLDLHKV
jgi:ribosomal protein S12 methylthiotransferase